MTVVWQVDDLKISQGSMESYKNGDIPVQNIWGCKNPMWKEMRLTWNATG